MLEYIKGLIVYVESNYVIIENNNIGFKVYVSNPFSFKIDEETIIYLYNQIREDEYSLYGFKSLEERELFLKLIGVKGLGPKMAMPMFATGSIAGITDAIDRENVLYLTKFPKIGEKLARQIVLDLKGKLVKKDISSLNTNDELINVLISLGYKLPDIKRVLPNIDLSLKIESQIKEALKLMMK